MAGQLLHIIFNYTYYGWYSNKKRGMQEKKVAAPGQPEPDAAYRRKCRMTWAALIKCVYEAVH